MPSLKAIRKRIASVKSTKKITSAMKLVAAARLRRAQDAIVAARPYAQRLGDVVRDLAAFAGADAHPLLVRPGQPGSHAGEVEHATEEGAAPAGAVALVVVTADRGLCGGFNSNINRRAERFLVDAVAPGQKARLYVVGRKGRDYLRRRRGDIIAKEWPAPQPGEQAYHLAKEIAARLTQDFLAGEVAVVHVLYNEFKSVVSQRPVVDQLLPVEPAPASDDEHGARVDFMYEPSRDELLSTVLPLYVETQVYRAMLETVAGFFGAQMSAMDSATNNASDMIARLTLDFNRARQAAITKELMEIVSGAEALKG